MYFNYIMLLYIIIIYLNKVINSND